MTEDDVTQTEASVEQHSLVQSVVLHLLPGAGRKALRAGGRFLNYDGSQVDSCFLPVLFHVTGLGLSGPNA